MQAEEAITEMPVEGSMAITPVEEHISERKDHGTIPPELCTVIDEIREAIALLEDRQCHDKVPTLFNLVDAIRLNMNESHRWPAADIRMLVEKSVAEELHVASE